MNALRDQFAKAAMQAVLSNRAAYPDIKTDAELARRCYDMADAMLKVRRLTAPSL